MNIRFLLLAVVTVATAVPVSAQDDSPRFCPNRPGLGSSTCTTGQGHVSV